MGFAMYDITRSSSLCVVGGGFFAIQTCTEHDAQSAPLLGVFILF